VYTKNIGLMLGFHGCSEAHANDAVMGTADLKESTNKYDWLGSGIYFWDRDEIRAMEFAKNKKSKPPAVVGAIINPGRCLDLRCREAQQILKKTYDLVCSQLGTPKVENRSYEHGVPLRRDLDCFIINTTCQIFSKIRNEPFDTVVGTFIEGSPVFPGAGINDKTHTQICVRNPKCILGYFLPRK